MENRYLTKPSVLRLLFISLGFLLSLYDLCVATSLTERTLSIVNDTTYHIERLGLPWASDSLSGCYFKCWSKYGSQCQTILFKHDTKLCTPGSFLRSSTFGGALPPTSSEGDLFASKACDTSDDFTYITSGDSSACIMVSTFILSPNDAANHCRLLGSYLFVARSLKRLELLPDNHRLIIGLSDQQTEGTFIWADNGDPIEDDYKSLLFISSEPNNLSNEDCVTVLGGFDRNNTANDIPCTYIYWKFVCERPMF